MTLSTDRIEKRVFLRAQQERVWEAISNANEFGSWFGITFERGFEAGKQIAGRITPTKADPDVAAMQEPYNELSVAFHVERIEPIRLFTFRWHPFAIDRTTDYSDEPMTLVTFTLEPADGGTMLTIVESGFDALPIERRANAFEANDEGWSLQAQLIEKYLLLPQS